MAMDWGFDPDAPIESTRSIMTPYGEQDENGVDFSLLDRLMEMPVAERIAMGGRARRSALRVRAIGAAGHERRI